MWNQREHNPVRESDEARHFLSGLTGRGNRTDCFKQRGLGGFHPDELRYLRLFPAICTCSTYRTPSELLPATLQKQWSGSLKNNPKGEGLQSFCVRWHWPWESRDRTAAPPKSFGSSCPCICPCCSLHLGPAFLTQELGGTAGKSAGLHV